MKTSMIGRAFALAAMLLGASGARAEDKALTASLEACRAEVAEYCTSITPGQGRVIACLYAHENDLSVKCQYVLFDAAAELQNIMGDMYEVGKACKPDIELLCAGIKQGEGRVLQCLKAKQKALAAPCADAIEHSGIEVQ